MLIPFFIPFFLHNRVISLGLFQLWRSAIVRKSPPLLAARAELTGSPVSIWVQDVKLLFFLPLARFTASPLCHLGSDGSLKPPASSHFFYLFRGKMLKMQSNASVGVAEKPFLSESKCAASRPGLRGGWVRGRDKHHESAETKMRDLSEKRGEGAEPGEQIRTAHS